VGNPSAMAWMAYLENGDRNWYLEPTREYKERFFRSDQEIVRSYVMHQTWNGDRESGRWQSGPDGRTLLNEATVDVKGTSAMEIVGQAINDIPVVGRVLKESGNVASFLWDGYNSVYYGAKGWVLDDNESRLLAAGYKANIPWGLGDHALDGANAYVLDHVDAQARKQ